MAEIKLHRNGATGRLWGVILLAIVALVLWWAFEACYHRFTVATSGATSQPLPTVGPPVLRVMDPDVERFLHYVDSTSARVAAARDHQYTADGVRRLAAAITALDTRDSLGGSLVAKQVDALRTLADRLQADPSSRDHADIFRAAATSSAQLLHDVQQRRYPTAGSDVTAVRDAAEAIAKDRPLLDQTTAIDTFFDRAADAVRAMSDAT